MIGGLADALGERILGLTPVAGGDLNDAYRAELAGGGRVFVKRSADAAPGAFANEAAGLAWLAAADCGLGVPAVLAVGEDFLALEWIESGPVDAALLGSGLARLHRAGAPGFGAPPPGAVGGLTFGALAVPDVRADSWAEVYGTGRLLPLAAAAARRGALSSRGVRAVEAVCDRLEELAGPPEPPARLHGDLWSGNVMGALGGGVHLIDPAAHGGHREMDLAMLELFGGPGPQFLDAYAEVYPLADGFADRVALWQLFPLLVHAVLFGGGYGTGVESVARRYAAG